MCMLASQTISRLVTCHQYSWHSAEVVRYDVQIKGGPLLQKQLVHNATIASIVPRWQTFEASQFDLQVCFTLLMSYH